MEQKIEVDFDFNKKTEQEIEVKPLVSETNRKRLKFLSFLIISGLSVGIGIGVTNNLMKGYAIDKKSKAHMEEIELTNVQIRQNKQNEVLMKENEQKRIKEEKLALLIDKDEYNVWVKNREDVIKNYESQLNLYNKAYQNSVQAVKDGLISLDDLNEIRTLYQDHKKNITEWINYINSSTISFEAFHILGEENKVEIKGELVSYQAGSLRRSPDLESALINTVSNAENDDEDNIKLQKLRTASRNKMIDDLADIMENNNQTTTHKKLKR